ncbi:NAD(P)/FAD-dependent oxidoreductase [Asticcacaulis sp. YBE204]|uniref:flavin-containing monooxygenase n=1 Tax=Asticcacaulis sp. YBE204 TaxID=1282363 RepID=UPI0003C3D54C|nr:NAD(P)/FAD-dependent oxidoreductase [Asticcacaulis sp. YBE204]ESQ79184.1 hypothetical protein AEYBE204_09245 [Asticcacaulis sp. YBE204]
MRRRVEPPRLARVYDVIVVGAGQSGLAAGYFLKHAGIDFVIIDRDRRVGEVWRKRYDSLKLFTPREFNGLPGRDMSGDPEGYPDRDEFADYLENYATHFELPILFGLRVDKVRRLADSSFELMLSNQTTLRARKVILAFGTYPSTIIPGMRNTLAPKVHQMNATAYKNPKDVPLGPVLVVGDGATGRDLAFDLADTHEVHLAKGRPQLTLPARLLGKSLWRWLEWVGLFDTRRYRTGKGLRRPIPSTVPQDKVLKARGVKLHPRLIATKDETATFKDAQTLKVRSVIWCVGYGMDLKWVDIPEAKDADGRIVHDRGVSQADGLYLVGRLWQSGLTSGLIYGAGPDAEYVVNVIVESRRVCEHADREGATR